MPIGQSFGGGGLNTGLFNQMAFDLYNQKNQRLNAQLQTEINKQGLIGQQAMAERNLMGEQALAQGQQRGLTELQNTVMNKFGIAPPGLGGNVAYNPLSPTNFGPGGRYAPGQGLYPPAQTTIPATSSQPTPRTWTTGPNPAQGVGTATTTSTQYDKNGLPIIVGFKYNPSTGRYEQVG